MTNIVVALIALGFVVAKVLGQPDAEKSEAGFCKHNEYPRSVEVGEYGEIKFMCEKLPRGCVNVQPKCNQIFFELSCKEHQWVGGVAGSSNLNNLVPLQCCEVPQVQSGRRLGVTKIRPRERFVGQEKKDAKDNLVSFDVITNVQKVTEKQNDYALEVHSVRMNCKGKGPSLDTAQLGFGGEQAGFGGDQGFQDQGFQDQGLQFGDDFGSEALPPLDNSFAQAPLDPGFGAQQGFGGPIAAPIPAAGGGFCFSGDTTVETPSGPVTMDELKVGTHVLTLEDGIQKYSPITSFIHRLPNTYTKFQKIQAVDGTSLKLTPKHFLYIAQCDVPTAMPALMFADQVRPGDCWVKVDNELNTQQRVKIESNTEVLLTGAYAPLTGNGVIVADGVMASCHAVYKNEEFMDAFTYYADKVKNVMGGLFGYFGYNLPDGTTELPWLVKYGHQHIDKLILGSK